VCVRSAAALTACLFPSLHPHPPTLLSFPLTSQKQGQAASDAAATLARALERALIGDATTTTTPALDLKSLCLAPGAVAWRLSVRVLLLACDGGEALAASLGARAALAVARIPAATVTGGGGGDGDGGGPPEVEVDDDLRAASRLDASRVPALLSLAAAAWPAAGGDGATRPSIHIVVDPTAAEAAASGGTAAVAVDGSGNVRGSALGGGSGWAPASLGALLAMARRVGPPLLRGVDEAVAAAEASGNGGGGGGGAMVVG
jgi:exosome complex component RRP42